MGGMEPPLILIVEDEKDIARFIELELQAEGYRTEVAHDGITGLSKFREVSPNLVILDLMLPVMDGIEVAKRIRKTSNVPILILTAKDRVEDKVAGLDAGADDYLVKPFSIEELLARVRAHLRRVTPAITGEIRVADLIINPRAGRSSGETAALNSPTRSLSFWSSSPKTPARSSAATRLRRRSGPATKGEATWWTSTSATCARSWRRGERRLIHTVRGVGYVLRED